MSMTKVIEITREHWVRADAALPDGGLDVSLCVLAQAARDAFPHAPKITTGFAFINLRNAADMMIDQWIASPEDNTRVGDLVHSFDRRSELGRECPPYLPMRVVFERKDPPFVP